MIHRIRASLSARLLLLLFVSVGLILTAHSAVTYRSTRADFLESVRASSKLTADLIRRATHDGMLLNRLDQVQDSLQRMAQVPEVAAVRVYDNQGTIVLSADTRELGRRIAPGSETCSSCHAEGHALPGTAREREAMIQFGQNGDRLRHLSVIPNEAECAAAGCHRAPSERKILGYLDVEMSIAPVDRTLRAAQRRAVWATVALVLVTGFVCGAFINRVVHRPVARLTEVTRLIAGGDLESRVDVRGSTELSLLGRSFNSMAEDLYTARSQITDSSHKLEHKVLEKTKQLRNAQRQVLHMEKMASLGKLSATVAHELNNPMNAMLTYARLIERELDDQPIQPDVQEELNRYLRVLQKECLRCGKIVTNLLLFSRASGAEMAPADLNEIVDRSLMLVQHHLQISQVKLRFERLDGDSRIVGDAGQLQQAVVALLVNAVEAMTGPDCTVRELSVSATEEPAGVCVEVSDTGVGIDVEALPQIFDPFFSTKEQSGTGLGLSVAYGIAKRHGGEIEVESRLGQGATFRLRLPREPQAKLEDANVGALA